MTLNINSEPCPRHGIMFDPVMDGGSCPICRALWAGWLYPKRPLFHFTDRGNAEYLAQMIGPRMAGLLESVKDLPPHHFIYIRRRTP